MTAIELARRAADLRDVKAAQKAYLLALNENNGKDPAVELECAAYLLITQGDADIALSRLVPLFNDGVFQQEAMDLMLQYCYVPAAAGQEKLYQRNMSKLEKYPYFFAGERKPVPFEDLPVRFFPLRNRGYVAYDQRNFKFGEYQDLTHEAVTHYFNTGGDKPIFVDDLYSQYELDYLRDCTRRSEDIARDNHIYLHFTSWVDFCSYAQVLDFGALLAKKKFVFLVEEQGERYPIDWLKDYGKDYSKEKVKPIRVEEVQRMIWHVQFSSHNGGDFFNEILDSHPNLIYYSSLMQDDMVALIDTIYDLCQAGNEDKLSRLELKLNGEVQEQFAAAVRRHLRAKRSVISKKDILVSLFLAYLEIKDLPCDPSFRFAPVLVYQPHFHNMHYTLRYDLKLKLATLGADEIDKLQDFPAFRDFKYVKSFLPVRRFTTSYAASIRFAAQKDAEAEQHNILPELAYTRIVNQSFYHDEGDPMYNDARMVRFEDGKLNPKATFTALARFLDIPYTESMTYCSEFGVKNVETMAGNAIGFDPVTVYRTYDDYTSETINRVLEYFLRNAMTQYGYDFHFYNGEPITGEAIEQMWSEEHRIWDKQCLLFQRQLAAKKGLGGKLRSEGDTPEGLQAKLPSVDAKNLRLAQVARLSDGMEKLDMASRGELRLVGKTGRDLIFTPLLQPDPDLLEQPLYH